MAYARPTASPKYSSSHSTSSAFSASANPNEDWTKISDLAERRRIQNRIAQRNYRKKIKRRLEDLEKRAGSSSVSPEQHHAELAPATKISPKLEDSTRKRRPKTETVRQTRRRSPEQRAATPYSSKPEIKSEFSSRQYDRDLSNSPPPFLNFPYSLPDPAIHTTYPQHTPFNTLPAPYPESSAPQQYNSPLPPTLPSMPPYEQSKQGCFYDNDDVLSQYPMGFAPFTSMELPMNQSYQDSNAHVNQPEYSFHFFQ